MSKTGVDVIKINPSLIPQFLRYYIAYVFLRLAILRSHGKDCQAFECVESSQVLVACSKRSGYTTSSTSSFQNCYQNLRSESSLTLNFLEALFCRIEFHGGWVKESIVSAVGWEPWMHRIRGALGSLASHLDLCLDIEVLWCFICMVLPCRVHNILLVLSDILEESQVEGSFGQFQNAAFIICWKDESGKPGN